MRPSCSVAVLVLVCASCGGGGASSATQRAASRPLTFQDLLAIQRPSQLELSPDGRRVAFVVRVADLENDATRGSLWTVDVAGGAPTRVTTPEIAASSPHWSPDGQQLAFIAADASGLHLEVIAMASGTARRPFDTAVAEFAWGPDGAHVVLAAPGSDPELPQLWVGDLRTGAVRQLTDEGAAFASPQWSPDGSSIAAVRFPGGLTDARFFPSLRIIDAQSGAMRTLSTPDEYVSSPRWAPDGTRLAYLSHPAKDEAHRALAFNRVAVVAAAGGTPRLLAANVKYQALGIAWSGDGARIFFEAFTDETGQLFSAPLAGGDATQLTRFEKSLAHGATYARDGSVTAFLLEDPQHPPEVHVSPTAGFAPKALTSFNAALRDASSSIEARDFRWTSQDGLAMSGVLLLPPGFVQGRPVPTLVVTHGGPATLIALAYLESALYSGAEVWASNGWAVLLPNFRGSTNRDEAFAMALIGQVGKGDLADVMSGVDALVAQGIADPDRLAHTGWSYGGFLSGWLDAHTTRFQAIVAGAGPYDWSTMYATSDDQLPIRVYLQGTPETNPASFREASTSTFVARAATPALVFGAGLDPLVPPSQPQAFADALEAQGVASELVIYEGEQHELLRPSNQLDKLERERAWILKFVPTSAPRP